MVLLSVRSTRAGQPGARSWWLVSAGLLANAVAGSIWLVEDQFLSPNHVPFPSLYDVVFALRYLFFFLALLLVPTTRPWVLKVRDVLDACLLLGAALAFSWYFLLAPLYRLSPESMLGKLVHWSYPVGDLAILFGLTLVWLRDRATELEPLVLALLTAAIVCLVVGDTWASAILLNRSGYHRGNPPDLFWMAFNLLVPLAGLVQFRLSQQASTGVRQTSTSAKDLRRQDLRAAIRSTSPIAAALLASIVLILRAERGALSVLPPPVLLLIALGLVVLALVRQGLTAMENERLRREREETLRQTTAQMETFLGVSGHELRNPLTSMRLGLHMVDRRIRRLLQSEWVNRTDVALLLAPVAQAERQEQRLNRLVNDLVDVTRVRAGKLELNRASTDLATIVREAVEEQRQANPEHTIVLEFPSELQMPVQADPQRIGQVVTNYLTNALKYSAVDRSVAVGLQVDDQQALLWVRDEGPGLSPGEQKRIWDRFHQAPGIVVQSGSGVGLGLGLHISHTIIEQHQGQVGVRSTPGQGSTFWFTLPLATPEPAQEGREASDLGYN